MKNAQDTKEPKYPRYAQHGLDYYPPQGRWEIYCFTDVGVCVVVVVRVSSTFIIYM